MKTSFLRFIFFGTLIALLAVACTNDDLQPGADGDKVAVDISAGVGGLIDPGSGNAQASTRATNDTWDNGDIIGVTMVAPQSMDVINPYRNFGYTTSGDIKFRPNDAGQILYFPTDDSKVTFRAYYPYKKELASNLMIPVSTKDQSSLPDIDLMTAEHLSGTSTADPNVRLHFYHRLAKVMVFLSTDEKSEQILNGVKLDMIGLKTEASYDLLNETLIVDNNRPDATVSIPVQNAVGEGIIMPRLPGEGVVFEITTADGGKYRAALSSEFEFMEGYVHKFYIRLKSPADITATIEPWIEGPERHKDAIRVVTGLGVTEGFDTGDELDLFLKEGTDGDFELLRTFTYNGGNKWSPETPVYWESISGDPLVFRGATVVDEALNDTQMDDILISKDVTVEPYTGVNLEMQHAGSKVTIVLQSSDGSFTQADLNTASVILPNYLNSGTYNDKGEFVPGTTRGNIIPEDNVAIFPPQTVETGDNIAVITINGRTYEIVADEPDGFDYQEGTAYTLVLDASKAKVEMSAAIVPWDEETIEYDEIRVGSADLGPNEGDLVDGDELILFAGDNTNREELPGMFVYDEVTDTWVYNGPSAPLYWEDITDQGNLYASITRPAISTASNNNQSPDYITAIPMENKGGATNTAVNFKLAHQVAKVNVILRTTTYEESRLLNASVTLPGYTIGGKLDKGIYVPGTSTGVITLDKPQKVEEGGEITYHTASYLQPQTIEVGDELVKIVMEGRTYTVKPEDVKNAVAAAVEYEAGKVTNLIITIEKTGVSISAVITGWDELPAMEYDVIRLITGLGITEGFEAGDELDLFVKEGAVGEFSLLRTFNYDATGTWTPGSPVYWEDLSADPSVFRAAAIMEEALNSTQMDDILISKDVTVDPYTGVNLEMEHVGSKVTIVLQSSDGTFTAADLNSASVVLPNFLNSGTYNDKGEFVPGTTRGNITPEDNVAIFPPQTVAGGNNIAVVTINGRDYEIPADAAGFQYSEGTAYTLVFDASKAKVEMSTIIKPWEDETHEFTEIRVGTADLGPNEGDLLNGDALYLFNGDDTDRASLPGNFEYNEATDTWIYSGPSSPLYWEDIPKTGNIYGSITRPAISTTAGNNQSPDYIVVTPVVNQGGTNNTAINFQLSHQVSKVNVILRSATYEESRLLNANVTLPGYKIGGTLDKGIYVPGTSFGPIALDKPVKTGEAPEVTYNTSAYLQPQTIAIGQDLVTVEIEGHSYTVKPEEVDGTAAAIEYEAGKVTNLIITIEKTGLSISTEITGWTELPALEFNDALFFSVANIASSGFENGDEIKFYKLDSNGTAVNSVTNTYAYAGGTDHGTLNPTGTPWYRDDFTTGDLISAVYPSAAPALSAGQRTFSWTAKSSGVTNAHEDDILIAAPVVGRNLGEVQTDGNVHFEFKHVLSKVTINLIAGEGFTNDEVRPSVVEMNNFQLSGTIDVIDGTATATGAATDAFNPTKLDQVYTLEGRTVVSSYEAFVMPQTITANTVTVTITLGDGKFEAKLPANKLFAAGAHNMLNLTLNKTGAVLTASIVNWNTEPDIDLELH